MNNSILKIHKNLIKAIRQISRISLIFLYVFLPIIIIQFLYMLFRIVTLENASPEVIRMQFTPILEHLMMSLFLTIASAFAIDLADKKL